VPALVWQMSFLGVLGVSLLAVALRILTIARQPIHLRWELAPVPRGGEKRRYGGSDLEEPEGWSGPRRRARAAALVYTAKEVFLLRSVWKHNRGLWPLTFALHYGLYLMVGWSLAMLGVAGFWLAGLEPLEARPLRWALSTLAVSGYLLGGAGAVGLLVKRASDLNLRPFTTPARFVNLLFLAAVFLSGGLAWLLSGDYLGEVGWFAHGLLTRQAEAAPAFSPFSFHVAVSLLFLLYLPATDMIHFVAKFFTYHDVRWDDRPLDGRMATELGKLMAQPVSWSAAHIESGGRKDWTEVAALEASDEPKA
jgi:nitrate reductase gamma subunit